MTEKQDPIKSRFMNSLNQIVQESESGDLSFRRIFEVFGSEGHAAIILFLCFPFLQPIPIPGLSTPLGAMIVFIGFLLFVRKPLYIPAKLNKNKIPHELVKSVQKVSEKVWAFSSKFIKPRWVILADFAVFRFFNFMVLITNAFLLALPLPIPFSNTVPTLGIVLLALGQLERDGIFIAASYIWLIFVFVFFYLIGLGVAELIW